MVTHALLEREQVLGRHRVSLGDDGDQVDARAEALHDLNVEGLDRRARGADEVETGVHTEVLLLATEGLLLLTHVGLVLVIDELHDRDPAVAVVDIVAEAGGVDDGELDVESTLLKVGLEDLDLGRLVELLGKAGKVSAKAQRDEVGRMCVHSTGWARLR